MRDHLHGGKGKDEFDQETFKRCTEFKMIRDVAEDSKHAELERSDVIVAGIGSLGGEATIISPLGSLQTVPPCTLQIDLKDGSSRMMEDVLATVARFLRAEVS